MNFRSAVAALVLGTVFHLLAVCIEAHAGNIAVRASGKDRATALLNAGASAVRNEVHRLVPADMLRPNSERVRTGIILRHDEFVQEVVEKAWGADRKLVTLSADVFIDDRKLRERLLEIMPDLKLPPVEENGFSAASEEKQEDLRPAVAAQEAPVSPPVKNMEPAISDGEFLALFTSRHSREERLRAIAAGGNVNARGEGMTPLMLLFRESERPADEIVPVMDALIQAGADINARQEKSERTPLMYAVNHEDPEVTKSFLKRNPDIGLADKNGWTAFMVACSSEKTRRSPDVLKALIEAGADINAVDRQKRTALDILVTNGNTRKESRSAMLECILKANPSMESDHPLLLAAIERGDLQTTEILAGAGAPVDASDVSGKTALHQAVSGRKASIGACELLKKHGADVNIRNKGGETPLNYACRSRAPVETVRWLIDSGADVNLAAGDGRTPLMNADTPEIQEILLKAGADVNAKMTNGMTALFCRVSDSKDKKKSERGMVMMEALLEAGAEVNFFFLDHMTLLSYALQGTPNEKIVGSLIAHGADVNLCKERYESPLVIAARNKAVSPELMEMLLKAGADPNAGKGSKKVLEAAAGNPEKTELLLKYGAVEGSR